MDELVEDKLAEAVTRLRDGLDPRAIYLYGSHAYGNPDEDSDVDLFIVVDRLSEPSYEVEARAYRLLSGLKIPAEIRVVSREDFENRRDWVASLEREIHERGIELYAAA